MHGLCVDSRAGDLDPLHGQVSPILGIDGMSLRRRKPSLPLTIWIDHELKIQLEDACANTGLTQKKIVADALIKHLEKLREA